jgi:4-diphosphocytidyl-2-C-methyl-D-erythritol kinase
MAGGSTDGAAVLLGMSELLSAPLSQKQLMDIALSLGADVPFCMVGGTQLTQGIGELLTPLPPLPPCFILIACGGEGVSTPWAYQALDGMYQNFDGRTYTPKSDVLAAQIEALRAKDLRGVCQNAYNIFESVVLPERPTAKRIKETMLASGAMLAMMSGSGPSVFGIFESEKDARQALSQVADCAEDISACEMFAHTPVNPQKNFQNFP